MAGLAIRHSLPKPQTEQGNKRELTGLCKIADAAPFAWEAAMISEIKVEIRLEPEGAGDRLAP
jgi:hypothetical protein